MVAQERLRRSRRRSSWSRPRPASGCFGRRAWQRDRAHEVQVGECPPALLEAEAVAREELIRHREPDEAEGQLVDETSVGTVEERHGRETCGLCLLYTSPSPRDS